MYPYNVRGLNQQNASPENSNMFQGNMFYMQPNQQVFNHQQMPPSNFAVPYNYQVPTPVPFQPLPTLRHIAPSPAVVPVANDAQDKQKLYKLEQQRKFKELGKNYKHTSIDSMLSNIVSADQPKTSQKKPEVVADDFGEFLQAPIISVDDVSVSINDSSVSKSSNTTTVPQADAQTHNFMMMQTESNHASAASMPTAKPPEPLKPGVDLQAKMLASLDLSQSKHAYRNFKPIAHQAVPKREKKTFYASSKAADWSSLNAVEGAFQEPEPELPPEPVYFPPQDQPRSPSPNNPWILDLEGAPLVYKHVYEACLTSDGLMDTSRLYPILLQCNLPNETLGHLWSLANQAVPGRLNQRELFVLLALISLTQSGYQGVTVNHVISLPAPPIPFLAAYATPDNQSNSVTPSADQSRVTTPPTTLDQSSVTRGDDFGDFQDFQSTFDSSAPDSASRNHVTSPSAALSHGSLMNSHVTSIQLPSENLFDDFTAFSSADPDVSQVPGSLFDSAQSEQASVLSSDVGSMSFEIPSVGSRKTASPSSLFKPIPANPVPVSVESRAFPPETSRSFPVDPPGNDRSSPVQLTKPIVQADTTDKYSAFSDLAGDSQIFQSFQENKSSSVSPPSFAADFSAFNPPDSCVLNAPTSAAVDEATSNGSGSDWMAFASPDDNTPTSLASVTQSSDPVSWTMISNPTKGGLLKSAVTNAATKQLDFSPAPSDNNSVQSLELGLSHMISQQSIGTYEISTDSKQRESPVKPPAHRFGPSFCDDDYDIDAFDEPPPDVPSGAYDEFDVFQEGNSTLVGFDVFEQPETKEEKRLPSASRPENKRKNSSDTPLASPVPSPRPPRKRTDSNDPVCNLTKQRLSISTPPLTPERLPSESLNSSPRSSRRQSINTPVDWHIDLTPTEQATVYVEKWETCLKACSELIATTNNLFSSITSPDVCKETVYSVNGQRYIADLSEVYNISKRISVSSRALKVETETLRSLMKHIEMGWHNLLSFCSDVPVINPASTVSENSIRCGVCLQGLSGDTISYAGSVYHSTCANFWVNCVEPLLPAFKLPDVMAGFG